MSQKKLVVIGGGAAGIFCAVNAARLNSALEVVVLEKTAHLLSKVKISGGGRCNVTHSCFSIAAMQKNYPRGEKFLKRPFHDFFTIDTIEWFKERGVELKTEADGRMFPDTNSSQTIIDCLLAEADTYKIVIRRHAHVKEITGNEGKFRLRLGEDSEMLEADYICLATGGYSKALQFDWLKNLGHSLSNPVPSLFTFNLPKHAISQLMGVVVPDVIVKIAGTNLRQQGPVLITHWGLSGPAVLKLSAWGARLLAEKDYNFDVVINWLPDYTEQTLLERLQQQRFSLAPQKIINRNPFGLSSRFWEFMLSETGIDANLRWADLPAKLQNKLAKRLCVYEIKVQGKTTFKEEFVTAGGIRLSEIDPQTMESRLVPGIYFAGEVMDVDGVTGGFNFQHAWSSGWLAARAIAQKVHA
ncbi:MAG: NAD(P)/FAD-dependent oxidoreductase [Ferruginibacter sp.]